MHKVTLYRADKTRTMVWYVPVERWEIFEDKAYLDVRVNGVLLSFCFGMQSSPYFAFINGWVWDSFEVEEL